MATLVRSSAGPAVHSLEPCLSCDARSVSVCSAIEGRDLSRLAAIADMIRVEPGRVFIEEGTPAHNFFNIIFGSAKLYKLLADGRRQITGFVGTGQFLGLAVSSAYAFNAEAIEPVRLCRSSRAGLHRLLDDFPVLERRILHVASIELVAAQEQMILLGRKTARERVASFLLSESKSGVARGRPRAQLRLAMSRSDIADYLGLTIETVSRTLNRFKKERLIEMPHSSELLIPSFEHLAAAAGIAS